jgi:hypothetical protein
MDPEKRKNARKKYSQMLKLKKEQSTTQQNTNNENLKKANVIQE